MYYSTHDVLCTTVHMMVLCTTAHMMVLCTTVHMMVLCTTVHMMVLCTTVHMMVLCTTVHMMCYVLQYGGGLMLKLNQTRSNSNVSQSMRFTSDVVHYLGDWMTAPVIHEPTVLLDPRSTWLIHKVIGTSL